jgi:hypothetical protein
MLVSHLLFAHEHITSHSNGNLFCNSAYMLSYTCDALVMNSSGSAINSYFLN